MIRQGAPPRPRAAPGLLLSGFRGRGHRAFAARIRLYVSYVHRWVFILALIGSACANSAQGPSDETIRSDVMSLANETKFYEASGVRLRLNSVSVTGRSIENHISHVRATASVTYDGPRGGCGITKGVMFYLRELAEWYGMELCRIAVDECLTSPKR